VLEALARVRSEPSLEVQTTDANLTPPPSALDAPRVATRGPRGMGMNLTPLIDVTFLILVFFVCTAQVLERETLLRADLSEQVGSVAVDSLDLEEPPLRIEIRASSGRRTIAIMAPLPQPKDAADLTNVLASRRYGPENPGGLFAADQPIELAPAADVSWERAVEVFNAVTRAGYTRVRFASPS
jgi:biopolymer transport protein ExbD